MARFFITHTTDPKGKELRPNPLFTNRLKKQVYYFLRKLRKISDSTHVLSTVFRNSYELSRPLCFFSHKKGLKVSTIFSALDGAQFATEQKVEGFCPNSAYLEEHSLLLLPFQRFLLPGKWHPESLEPFGKEFLSTRGEELVAITNGGIEARRSSKKRRKRFNVSLSPFPRLTLFPESRPNLSVFNRAKTSIRGGLFD